MWLCFHHVIVAELPDSADDDIRRGAVMCLSINILPLGSPLGFLPEVSLSPSCLPSYLLHKADLNDPLRLESQ